MLSARPGFTRAAAAGLTADRDPGHSCRHGPTARTELFRVALAASPACAVSRLESRPARLWQRRLSATLGWQTTAGRWPLGRAGCTAGPRSGVMSAAWNVPRPAPSQPIAGMPTAVYRLDMDRNRPAVTARITTPSSPHRVALRRAGADRCDRAASGHWTGGHWTGRNVWRSGNDPV